MSGAGSRRRTRRTVGREHAAAGARIIPLWPTTEIPLPERGNVAGRRPLIVAADEAGYAAAVAELTGAGWTVVDIGRGAGAASCTRYPIHGRGDAQAVVVAAVRGGAVLAHVGPGADADPELDAVVDDLIDDLAGLGPVLHVDAATAVRLDEDSWRLAHEIARGATLESAARLLHLSPRTANRRLTVARQALGVDSRAQLVRALTSAGRVPPAISCR
ncbi:helix-turn-helix transcriptional regulator [uncultured Jatrophihabitans sp.]|uniref:helix-turn-helix transcriptional regulator n=1 Tax=uncultured Jatrophihabitans sp. TaxID=1610747 RepID=UPI0035C96895